MIGLLVAILVFNSIAFKTNKCFTAKQMAHIWMFTIAFQLNFDVFVEIKYFGYWYFTQDVDWKAFPTHTVLLPPVNIMILN